MQPVQPLPDVEHRSRPWRIHELTADFRLEDVWALQTPGGPDDFPRLVQAFATGDPAQSRSTAVRTLFAIRWKLGALLDWDGPDAGLDSRVPTLRHRLPADLRDAPPGPEFGALPFRSLYLLDDEFAAEIANRTVHGVLHLSWVPADDGGYRGQMAVLVKPNEVLGTAYLAAIRPFRHSIVYPALIRQIEREWRRGGDQADSVRQIAVPPDARALSTLPRIDYADSFLVDIESARDRTPERWARAILEDAPITVRRKLWCGWSALGLRLGPARSERFVLGWEVRRSNPDFVLLGARSRLGMPAELLLERHEHTLRFTTFVQQSNHIARVMWAGVVRRHREIVPDLLARSS